MRKENFCTGWTVRPLPGKQWAPVRLPHDAMIHELRQQQNPSGAGGGYYPGGAYVYRGNHNHRYPNHTVYHGQP